ncbi:hypothetical protein RO3G_15475 [Rhizopus delemar RA 99-880]|uniref:Uncharacterized protein n=1 Tax=Rhizopus delemar (strain RA 99-880 / ATCC MYA-4621 / FGSC 9543 / NRRL 43880) TaxID=246409 RepID=I1CQN4_RHIO9|nr:hypothetical protein RO3G_15475 [Rhizopus delemar RA 99-880]|eukprot:EIE90764.1 hypothetical protein RO3G_15475 [Rhizopus delemar RA 99-880]
MSMQFLDEDRQRHAVDEHGVEPMDLVVDKELFAIEISSRTQFLMNKSLERYSNLIIHPVSDESKCLSASAATRQLGRRRIFGERHKQFLFNYIDENTSAVLIEVVKSLLQNFVNLNVSRSAIYNFMTMQCNLSIKQAQFQPVERNSEEKIQQRYDWVQKWQQTDLDFITNCVFLNESAFHVNLK